MAIVGKEIQIRYISVGHLTGAFVLPAQLFGIGQQGNRYVSPLRLNREHAVFTGRPFHDVHRRVSGYRRGCTVIDEIPRPVMGAGIAERLHDWRLQNGFDSWVPLARIALHVAVRAV